MSFLTSAVKIFVKIFVSFENSRNFAALNYNYKTMIDKIKNNFPTFAFEVVCVLDLLINIFILGATKGWFGEGYQDWVYNIAVFSELRDFRNFTHSFTIGYLICYFSFDLGNWLKNKNKK